MVEACAAEHAGRRPDEHTLLLMPRHLGTGTVPLEVAQRRRRQWRTWGGCAGQQKAEQRQAASTAVVVFAAS